MAKLKVARGLYETLVTEALREDLGQLEPSSKAREKPLQAADAADRIALHLGRVLRRELDGVSDNNRVALGVALARRLVAELQASFPKGAAALDAPSEPGALLEAVTRRLPDGTYENIAPPDIPLLDTTLLTNAPGEPRVGRQLVSEIESADRIDVVMAFIRISGIRPFLDALERHCNAGRALRVVTTSYTGSTQGEALELLQERGAAVKVSYDTSTTRLHAKAWLFHRASGFSTAYVGSSNLTHSAQVHGLEWNVRVSGARNPDVLEKVSAVFESYWSGGDFEDFDAASFADRTRSEMATASTSISPIELRLEPFQERLLEQVTLSRLRGHHRNLLVAATGTGKTVMAAVDYARLRQNLPRARLLFVAHRMQLLVQALATYRHALRDGAFGELWVGGQRPQRFEHVFASIQSLSHAELEHLARDHFDVVVFDEIHHGEAPSYQRMLEHLEPRELLGLTATPERTDGQDILPWFGGRIAAELRLWDAIDQRRLTPFAYYGVAESLDLSKVTWRRGHGYDRGELSNLVTGDHVRARHVLSELARYVDDPTQVRCLGFCVSVKHAQFMARVFNEHGLKSVAIWAETPSNERHEALLELAARRLNVIFSVDLFNEGVDVPAVDTLLFLRPTDSPTLFLQQLGRGLRRLEGKASCTVLDFVGQHRREFRFDRKLRALLGGTRREVERQVERGFPFLPAGCHMQLDAVATQRILQSLKQAIPSQWPKQVDALRELARAEPDPTLADYLEETGLELEDVYANNRSWSDLRAAAGLPVAPAGPHEAVLRRACGRLLHVDDGLRLEGWRRLLGARGAPDLPSLALGDRRLLRMLVATLFATSTQGVLDKDASLEEAAARLWAHPQVLAETLELFDLLGMRVDHLHEVLKTHPEVPLLVHARYARDEILSALGVDEDRAKPRDWREGVRWLPHANTDVFVVTLDKTGGGFSPTTRYRDYALNRECFHWESQSTTSEESDTGRRYREHAARGSSVLLFARRSKDDRAFWFLGPATYVKHEGERPMAITWRLSHKLPGDLFASFAAAVA